MTTNRTPKAATPATPAPAAPAPAAEPAAPAPKLCLCGCGATVAREFKPGHDARLKGALIDAVLSGERPDASPALKTAGAKALLTIEARGWGAHLEKSRASRAAKVERKAAREAEKAAAKAAPAQPAQQPAPAAQVDGEPARTQDEATEPTA